MSGQCIPGFTRTAAWWRILPIASVLAVLLITVTYVAEAASLEIPPEVEKKAVSLKKSNVAAERTFAASCGRCHKPPDPAKHESAKSSCASGLSTSDVARVQSYLDDVLAGKRLYETYCGRCHALIDPGSHKFDYWSKNICTSDSCMVKRKLTSDEEQRVLLYLSSHAKRN